MPGWLRKAEVVWVERKAACPEGFDRNMRLVWLLFGGGVRHRDRRTMGHDDGDIWPTIWDPEYAIERVKRNG